MYGALYFCSRWRMFPSIIMVHPYIYFVNEHFKKLQIKKILKIQQIRLAGRACRLSGIARTRRFERLRKQIQKAEARGLPAPSLPAVLYGGYCHTPEGAPGRACRLRGTARTRRFERLRKQIQKAEARGCLPLASAFWSTCADSNRGSPESESDVLSSCTTGRLSN